jgi:hypothetical protein
VAGSSPVFRSLIIKISIGKMKNKKMITPDNRRCSSVVEHFLGKEEVGGSIPPNGSPEGLKLAK